MWNINSSIDGVGFLFRKGHFTRQVVDVGNWHRQYGKPRPRQAIACAITYSSFKAASHDGQKLVITTSKRPTTWRPRYLDHSHVLGKKVIIFPSFDAGASGQLKTCQCQCKIVLKFCLKQGHLHKGRARQDFWLC